MAWWDYGYQITGIANRTTIADGNTWNHEHIALLGLALTTDVDEGYEIARHLADYVLIWGGGGGDDLGVLLFDYHCFFSFFFRFIFLLKSDEPVPCFMCD